MTQDKFYQAQEILNNINECDSVIGFLEARKTIPTFVNSCNATKNSISIEALYACKKRVDYINNVFEKALSNLIKKTKLEKMELEKRFDKL